MRIVKFPGINLSLNISNVAIRIFGIEIYWYAILMVFAIALGMLLCKKKDGLYNIKFSDILDLSLYVIPISIISARLYYVIFSIKNYIANPMEIFNIRNGGLAIYGAIIGGAITCIIFCKKRKINILDLFDYIAPSIVLGQGVGRWGNFANVEAYGKITTVPWRMGIMEMGKYIEVHPTFLYESLTCFLIFIILLIIKNKRKFSGQITCIYLLLYSLERTFVEGLRTDSLMLGNIRVSQILSILIFTITFVIYVIKLHKARGCNKMS